MSSRRKTMAPSKRCSRAALIVGPRGNAAPPFLESLPEGSTRPNELERETNKLEEVVKSAEQVAALGLVD